MENKKYSILWMTKECCCQSEITDLEHEILKMSKNWILFILISSLAQKERYIIQYTEYRYYIEDE